jgi:hypothetical protein
MGNNANKSKKKKDVLQPVFVSQMGLPPLFDDTVITWRGRTGLVGPFRPLLRGAVRDENAPMDLLDKLTLRSVRFVLYI